MVKGKLSAISFLVFLNVPSDTSITISSISTVTVTFNFNSLNLTNSFREDW